MVRIRHCSSVSICCHEITAYPDLVYSQDRKLGQYRVATSTPCCTERVGESRSEQSENPVSWRNIEVSAHNQRAINRQRLHHFRHLPELALPHLPLSAPASWVPEVDTRIAGGQPEGDDKDLARIDVDQCASKQSCFDLLGDGAASYDGGVEPLSALVVRMGAQHIRDLLLAGTLLEQDDIRSALQCLGERRNGRGAIQGCDCYRVRMVSAWKNHPEQ